MKNNIFKNKTCFEILKVHELSTLKEIQLSYYKLSYKYKGHSKETEKINKAFLDCKESLSNNETEFDLYFDLFSITKVEHKKQKFSEFFYNSVLYFYAYLSNFIKYRIFYFVKFQNPKLIIYQSPYSYKELIFNLYFINLCYNIIKKILKKLRNFFNSKKNLPQEKNNNQNYKTNIEENLDYYNKENLTDMANNNSDNKQKHSNFSIKINFKNFIINFDFKVYANDFFQKLILNYNIYNAPLFTDSDFVKFYNFWGKFNHEDKILEQKIKKIIKIIKENDTRNNISKRFNNAENNNGKHIKKKDNYINEEKIVDKEITKKANNDCKNTHACLFCNKKFKSENTFKDHIRSKSHNKIILLDEELKEHLQMKNQNNDYKNMNLDVKAFKNKVLCQNKAEKDNNISDEKSDKATALNDKFRFDEKYENSDFIGVNKKNNENILNLCSKTLNDLDINNFERKSIDLIYKMNIKNINIENFEPNNYKKFFSQEKVAEIIYENNHKVKEIENSKSLIEYNKEYVVENVNKDEHILLRMCGICKKVFPMRSDLVKHLKTDH